MAKNENSLTQKEIDRLVMEMNTPRPEDAEEARRQEAVRAAEENSNEDSPVALFNAEFTEAGNADRFGLEHAGEYLYNNSLGWLVWNGQKWAEGDGMNEYVRDQANDFTRLMLSDALRLAAGNVDSTGRVPRDIDELMKHARRSRNRKSIDAIVSLTQAHLYKPASVFDADPNILNTPAGIVDLRTGDTKPHDREAYCTKITKAAPSEKGMEEWVRFVKLICCDDPDLVCYLQEVTGAALFGRVVTEGLYIAVGDGFNGKSTFYNAVRLTLGDYADTLDSGVLTDDRNNKDAKLATVRGKRLMVCGEIREGAAMSESFIKQITSTDHIQIKMLYKNPEEIRPTHTICLHTNHLPKIRSMDNGIWRRVHPIPFNATMPKGRDTIKNYAEQLAARCGGAILQWAIDGAIYCAANSFNIEEPAAVAELRERYKAGQDRVRSFLAEYCIEDATTQEGAGRLYQAYKAYCLTIDEKAKHIEDFKADMRRLGYRWTKDASGAHWQGLCLDPSRAPC